MSTARNEMNYRDQELPNLVKSEESCRITLIPGEKYTRKLSVSAGDRRKVMGIVTSSHRRILLSETELNGTVCEFVFGIDTKGLREGDHIDGMIQFITNLGEDEIPVYVEIADRARKHNGHDIRTLEDFTEVCQRSMREGFRIFTGDHFRTLLTGTNAGYRALYAGLSRNPVTYQNLEEFLTASGQKEVLDFSPDKEEVSYLNMKHSERGTMYLFKNTWGYAQLDIEVRGDFIHVLKKQILTEEFVGKVFALEYIIDYEKLGKGIRHGEILVHGVRHTITLHITATVLGEDELVPDHRGGRRLVSLARGYLGHCLGQTEDDSWQEKAVMDIQTLRELSPDNADYILCEAYLAYLRGDHARTIECLWPVKEGEIKLEGDKQKAAYLYLSKSVGLLPDEKRNILPRLKTYYQNDPGSYLLLSLMLRDAGTDELPERRLERLQMCYEAGCNSPFLFFAAWKLIASEERLLRRLTPFAIRLLQFGVRYDLLTESQLTRVAFLSHNLKRFSSQVFDLLTAGWEKYPSDEVLEAVTTLMTKGQPVQKRFHIWYARAVERDLRITNLYEYYMETIEEDPEEGLPLPVLVYFSANDTLSDRRRAFLYASVIRHRDDQPEIMRMYIDRMYAFAERALEAGMINNDFAVLYRAFFQKAKDGRTAALMAGVMFSCRLECGDPSIQNVCVCYEGIEKEERYPVIGGIAYPSVYTTDAAVIFEDNRRRRICTGIAYTMTPMFDSAAAAQSALRQNIRHTGLLYYGCGVHAHEMRVQQSSLPFFRLAAEHPAFTEQYRQTVRRKLLDYYLGQPGDFDRIDFVNQMDPVKYAAADKAGTVSLLMEEGKYEEVFSLISEYGYERVGEGDLLQLASRLIMRRDQAYDEELLYLTLRVYASGKYDENMLVYLRSYYDGPVRILSGLWKKLSGFQLDTEPLTEKILKQAVFAHVFPSGEDEILRDYLRARGNVRVTTAYLAHAARACLTAGRPMADALYECAELLLDQEQQISTGMQICLLRHYADMDLLSDKQMETAQQLLSELDGRGIRFGFYQQLPHQLTEQYQIQDKLYVEEHLRPGAAATIHYRLQEGASVPGEWIHEPMQEMYHGIFVKELLLFYGETVTYYVTEVRDGTERKMKEHQLSITGANLQGSTRFSMLNRMLKARADGDRAACLREMDEYLQKEAFVNELLKIME